MFCNKAKVPERCNQYSKRWSQIQINMCLEADETKRLRMDGIEPRINEDHIEGKGYSSLHHYNLVHKFIPMPQAMKIQAAKEAVDKEWRKLEKFSAWNLAKVRHKSEVTEEVRHKDVKVHFAWLMDICHLRISELETKYQKNKGRVALRGDIVNDDSYSYVVFVKQGASASQMTAAKIIDIISQLSGCEGQAATQYLLALNSRWKMIQNYWKFHDRNFEIFGYVYQDTHGLNHGPVWKTRSFLLNESCMVILWQDYKVFHWESLSYDHQQKFILPVYVDDIKLTGRKKNINPTWEVLNKQVELGEPTSFFDHVYLECTQRHCDSRKHIVDNYRTMFESGISVGATGQTTKLGKSTWFYVVLRLWRSCHSMWNDIAIWQKKNWTIIQSINSMHWWTWIQWRRFEIRGWIVRSMWTNCSQMSIFGTNW